MPTMTIALSEGDARFILEALRVMRDKWMEINHSSTDEDEQADYGMDAAVLEMTREKFEAEALKTFGPHVKEFSREPICAVNPCNSRPQQIG